jgi:tetratricopeptide (TPR) repeat protein
MKAEAVSQWWSQTKRLLAALPRGLPTLAPLRSLLVDFGVILVMIVLFVSIVLQVADPAPVADPISVPKSLADVGYSAEVFTTRLIDRSRAIEQANNAGIDRTSAAAATTGDANLLSTVTVPSAGVSLAVVVAGVRRFIGLPSRHIGGYIVIDNGGGGGYRMTVRVSGRDAPLEYTGKANASIEHVIEHGARALTGLLRPCVLAADLREDPDGRDWLADCFNDPSHRDIAWAHNLRGLLYFDEGKYEDAIKAYDEALRLSPGYRNAKENRAAASRAMQD